MRRIGRMLLVAILLTFLGFSELNSQVSDAGSTDTKEEKYRLAEAVMCERIDNFKPVNRTVVFSISRDHGLCYTRFDPVREKTHIYHRWYRRDLLSSARQLFLEPPRWSTFSSIQLREADKGPWRVEVTDENGRILEILRFSVTD